MRAEPGSHIELESTAVDTHHVGATCELGIVAENQDSVHPGNDLMIASGESFAILRDVEGEPGRVSSASPTIVLGHTTDAPTTTTVVGEVESGSHERTELPRTGLGPNLWLAAAGTAMIVVGFRLRQVETQNRGSAPHTNDLNCRL